VIAFDSNADPDRDPVFRLMVNTFATMFRSRALLDDTVTFLQNSNHYLVPVNAADWQTPEAMHQDLAASLDFPGYYGHNMDAFNDCLRTIAEDGLGWPPTANGFVLVFLNFDRFAARHPREAWDLLDIIAKQARAALLFGRRMFCLVHSDDPDLAFEPIGAMPVMWNDAEWLDANRR
jgi:RNAse (barnase) inhibitor barstar